MSVDRVAMSVPGPDTQEPGPGRRVSGPCPPSLLPRGGAGLFLVDLPVRSVMVEAICCTYSGCFTLSE
jgi:hypothetical protein